MRTRARQRPSRSSANPRRGPVRPSTPATARDVDGLQRAAGNQAIVKLLGRGREDVPSAPPRSDMTGPMDVRRDETATTVDVTVTWTTRPPNTYLQTKVLDVHPPDWHGDVYVDGKKVASGDGSAVVQLTIGSKPAIRVVPTAMAGRADYFKKTGIRKFKIDASTTSISRPLVYNRQNARFYEASWENENLDVSKVNDTHKPTLLGQTVTLNKLTQPRVAAANAHWDSIPEAERKAAASTIITMGGYNRRTTTSGSYSNHSTGCAVDINAHMPTKQNHHFKKGTRGSADRKLMAIVAHVVRLHPDFATYDPWQESDPTRILEASDAFDAAFPGHLAALLDEVVPADPSVAGFSAELAAVLALARGGASASALDITSVVDRGVLARAAKAADKAGKSGVASQLRQIGGQWTYLRAWTEGIVLYKTFHKGGREWAYRHDHEAAVAAGRKSDKDVAGSLSGMVDIHPRIVESLLAGGWTWLVTSHSAKDFMHFEDREAQGALKK